jgi:hypothetical protein
LANTETLCNLSYNFHKTYVCYKLMEDEKQKLKNETQGNLPLLEIATSTIAGLGAGFLTFQYQNGSKFLERLQQANETLKPNIKDWVDLKGWDDYKKKIEHAKTWAQNNFTILPKDMDYRDEQIDIFNVLKEVAPKGEELVNAAKIAVITALVAGIAVYAVETMMQPKEQQNTTNNVKEPKSISTQIIADTTKKNSSLLGAAIIQFEDSLFRFVQAGNNLLNFLQRNCSCFLVC